MAVKVIEYGRRRVRCPECLSMLEFEKNDIKQWNLCILVKLKFKEEGIRWIFITVLML